MTDAQDSPMARRTLSATGTATALTLGNVDFAAAEGRPGREPETRTVRGTLPPGSPDFVYVPVDVPAGVRELRVSYGYDRPAVPAGTPGNALDIGLFDERGTELGGEGFRASASGCGWTPTPR